MAHELLVLGVLLVLASLLGRLARRIGLPTIPVFMVVGLLASPAVEFFPLNIEYRSVELIATFGLILLLFHLGLDFDLDDFVGNARSLLLAGGAYILLNFGAGIGLGFLIGWGTKEALVIAGIAGVSSSAIVTKLLIELNRLTNRETPMILGVIVVEDVFVALYLAVLTTVIGGSGSSTWATILRLAGSFAFLAVMFFLARKAGPVVGRLIGTRDDELFTIGFFGLAILLAGTGGEVGVSEAIGAFLMGLIISGTRFRDRTEELVLPLRDVFAAVFFLAFGVTLDPSKFGGVIWPVVVAVVLTVAANLFAGWLTTRANGLGLGAAINAGFTLLSRGEFALILATLAAGAGLDPHIPAFAGLYVLSLAIIGPILATHAPRIGALVTGRPRQDGSSRRWRRSA